MASSALCLHRGARTVSFDELAAVEAPPATTTWFPLRHRDVLATVKATLAQAGFPVRRETYALSRENHRFFGTLDLENEVCTGVALSVGVRNSTDKSFPIGFCCGERVFVCDNLSFGSEIVIAKRHTRFGKHRFDEGIAQAVVGLTQYQAAAAARIQRMRERALELDTANSLLLQAWEEGILSTRLLPKAVHAWRHPEHQDFESRTAWSLFNALTGVLKERLTQPAVFASLSIKLQALVDAECTLVTAA